MAVNSAEESGVGYYKQARQKLWNRNYTLTGSESTTQQITMFTLPDGFMITSLVLYHETLGDVTLKVGTSTYPAALIATEYGNYKGSGWLGQGVTTGLFPSTDAQVIIVTMTKNSGSYTTGAKIQMWAEAIGV